MKSLIIPFVAIVGLIVFFVITGCKDFNPESEINQTQAEEKREETKPAAQTKHAESMPATETKPMIEPEPVAETKPAEDQIVEIKPVIEEKSANLKPVAKTMPVKPVPVAVPVVSQREAEELNVFGLFLSTVKKTVVEGVITERSELPNPEKSDYPNCRFTAHFQGNSIKSGEPCPKELSLIVEGFENYHILPNNDIKTGDKVLCTIFPFEQLPEDYQSTQQADDLELFLLESYYVLDIKTIRDFTDNELMPVSGIFFSDGNEEFVSLFERHINPPIPQDLIDAQNISIQNDLKKMNEFLNEYDDQKIKDVNELFAEAWAKEKAKDAPNYNRVDNYVWRNMENSFWTLPARTNSILEKTDMMSQQMLDCFLSLKQALEANGVHLIVSLVPTMNVISARVIVNEFKDVPDIQTATYVKQLSEIGVETVYASDRLIQNYNRFPFAYFLPSDSHPADTTQDILSDILVERLQRYKIKKELLPELFSIEIGNNTFEYGAQKSFIFPANCDIGTNQVGSCYTPLFRKILYDGKTITRAKESPVIVVGNSYMQYPLSPSEALPSLLSYKLCSPVDWHSVSGYGPFSDILIQLLSNPDSYLKNKKVFIVQVGTIHITAVNRLETMLDIAKLDSERVLLNNKKVVGHLLLQSNASIEETADSEFWGPLSNVEKTVLKIDETGKLTYNFKIDQIGKEISSFDPIVCIIPHTCVRNTTCKVTVNEKTEMMHSPNNAINSRFFNLTYVFPAGTKEITMKIEGTPGTLIAIKDIQIWQ